MTQVTKGYKFRIYPNKAQADLLARSFGCTRFVWNNCLAKSIENYEAWKKDNNLSKPNVGMSELCLILTQLKSEHLWLYEVSNVALQQTTRNLATAFSNFFRELKKGKVAYPRFKKKHNRNSITLTRFGFRIKEGKFYVAKSKEPVKVQWSWDLPSEPSSCTISQESDGKFYVSFICQSDPKLTNGDGKVGIDLGLTDFAVLSDGTRIENPKCFVKSQRRLKRLQQNLSRKTKGSKNRNKARIKVAKHYAMITNQRNDFLHKLSRKLVNENQVISIESLQIKNMVRNRHLAKGISEVSWGRFVEMLEYKSIESHHCQLVMMHPHYPSSKLCSSCGYKYAILKLSDRNWECVSCKTNHDRDLNAAFNILAKGLRTIQSLSPMGQWSDKILVGSLDPVLV